MSTATLTTTATYQNGVLLPKEQPTFPLKEVVVVYIPAVNHDEETEVSPEWKKMIDESLEDVKAGRVNGPFSSADELIKTLRA